MQAVEEGEKEQPSSGRLDTPNEDYKQNKEVVTNLQSQLDEAQHKLVLRKLKKEFPNNVTMTKTGNASPSIRAASLGKSDLYETNRSRSIDHAGSGRWCRCSFRGNSDDEYVFVPFSTHRLIDHDREGECHWSSPSVRHLEKWICNGQMWPWFIQFLRWMNRWWKVHCPTWFQFLLTHFWSWTGEEIQQCAISRRLSHCLATWGNSIVLHGIYGTWRWFDCGVWNQLVVDAFTLREKTELITRPLLGFVSSRKCLEKYRRTLGFVLTSPKRYISLL